MNTNSGGGEGVRDGHCTGALHNARATSSRPTADVLNCETNLPNDFKMKKIKFL